MHLQLEIMDNSKQNNMESSWKLHNYAAFQKIKWLKVREKTLGLKRWLSCKGTCFQAWRAKLDTRIYMVGGENQLPKVTLSPPRVWYMDVYMHACILANTKQINTKVGRKKSWPSRSETENGSFLWILYIHGRLSNFPTMSCHFASIGVLHSSGNFNAWQKDFVWS